MPEMRKSGMIAVSRPVGKGSDTAEMIQRLGWTPLIFHTVELKPLASEKIRHQIESVLSTGRIDWIVFMSSTGVELFFDNLAPQDRHILSRPNRTRFLAVGPRTKQMLVSNGVSDADIPETYSSTGVDDWFSRIIPKTVRILLVRSASAEDALARSLEYRGATVTTINLYESVVPDDTGSVLDLLSRLKAGEIGAVLFTSAVSVSNFFKIAETRVASNELAHLLENKIVGAIGPVTARMLWDRHVKTVIPDEYLIEKAIAKLIETVKADSSKRLVA
ncbi:MAG TPA: uroporphyrinogen-III synthase [Candidatus Bathyarchaeia archaeon]|nr:uroporphyrinogen-III synthase [Candidatus Bathyarchaeia archaeon]